MDLTALVLLLHKAGYHRPISQKAAAILHSLIQNHGFVDGNKRTALLAALLLIERSGYRLTLKPHDRIDDTVVDVAEGRLDIADLTNWYRARLTKQP